MKLELLCMYIYIQYVYVHLFIYWFIYTYCNIYCNMFSLKWLNWSLESPRSIILKISKVTGQGIFAKRPFSTSRSSTGLTLTWEISNESRKQQEIYSEAPTSYTTSKSFWFQDHFWSFLGFQYVSLLNEPDYPSPFVEPHKPSPGASAPWGQARRQHGCATYHNDWWWKGWVRMGKNG